MSEDSKQAAIAFYDLMFNECRPREAIERYAGDEYIQHNPEVQDGKRRSSPADCEDPHMGSDEPDFRVLSILDEDAVSIVGGSLRWVPLRRRLGIRAFGTNAYRARRSGEPVIEDHVESPGQEELYVVLAGRVRFVVGEEEFDAPTGTAIFLSRPDLRRRGTALEDDTVVLAVGGWPDQPYHSLPWEPIYLAQESMRHGDWATAAEILEREAGEHRDTAIVQFRLACCHARLGKHALALKELRRAIELNPGMRERAASEDNLAPLRELEDWTATLG